MPYANPEDRRRNSREYYLKNREKRLAYAKAYRESHKDKIEDNRESPGGREYHRMKAKEYYWRNRDKEIQRSREYREANPEKIKAYRERNGEKRKEQSRAWQAANKEHIRDYNRNYAATHPAFRELKRINNREWAAKLETQCRVDASVYAEHRSKARVNYANRRIKAGKSYSPNVHRRVPDYLTRAEYQRISEPARMGWAMSRDAIERGVKWTA